MRSKLVGTVIGNTLLGLSRFQSIKSISAANPEQASMIGNAALADVLIARLCPSNGTFVDIGAHIGSIFSSVHHADKTVSIIAFEADPVKAKELSARFTYCTLHAVAVGDQPGEIEFYLNPAASGYNSLVKSTEATQTTISVEMAKLDDVLEGQQPDVMKIDIEGAELGALRGAAKLIAANTPTIMFESADIGVNTLGYSPELLWEWFRDMGYGIYAPDRLAHYAPEFALATFLDGHEYPMRTLNYFAVHKDKRSDVRNRAREILGIQSTT